MSSTEKKSEHVNSFAEIMKEIMKNRINCLIISKMIETGFSVTSSDRLVIQNENGIFAYLILTDGSEYWWCDDGCCFMSIGGLRDRMLRYERLDIRI